MKTGVKKLRDVQVCPRRYALGSTLNITTEKTAAYNRAAVAKKVLTEFFIVTESDRQTFIDSGITPLLDQSLDKSLYIDISLRAEKEDLEKQLKRYLQWLTDVNAQFLGKGQTRDLKVPGSNTLIEVSCDYFVSIEGEKYAVVLKTGKPHLSPQGRNVDTATRTSLELYLLEKLAVEVLGDGTGAFHHLRNRGEKEVEDYGKQFISEFGRPGKNEELILKEVERLFGLILAGENGCNTSTCTTCRFKGICGYEVKKTLVLESLDVQKKAEGEVELTPSQRKAVLFQEGVIRVNAGAGSGKTTVVALRVAELIFNGVNPSDILLITFTNKGAGEMRDKIRYWLDKEGLSEEADNIRVETFNSWGGKIITTNHLDFGFSEPPRLIDKVEKNDIILRLLSERPQLSEFNYKAPLMNFPRAKGVVVIVSNAIDYIKAQGTFNLEDKFPTHASELIELFESFNAVLREKNLIEYQDQIRLLNEAIDNGESFFEKYDYEHIIVDEFQDTDSAQMDVILHLTNQPKFKSLMIVGDDAQSIYGFRNTSQENILNFGNFFTEMADIKLMENFRSVDAIIRLANNINDLNEVKLEKTLIPIRKAPVGYKPSLESFVGADAEFLEGNHIVSEIQSLVSSGEYNPEDIAVIARTRNELFKMHQLLTDVGVPSIIEVPEPILKNPLLLLIKNLLASINDPDVTLGFANYLHIVDGDITLRNKAEIEAKIKEMQAEISMINEVDEEAGREKRSKFFSLMDRIQDDEIGLFLEELREKDLTFQNMKSYVDKFVEYEDAKVMTPLSETPVRAVKLITVHAAKGKEYKVVFLTLTKFKDGKTEAEMSEERRTLFVGITRAMDKLYLSIAVKAALGKSKLWTDILHATT